MKNSLYAQKLKDIAKEIGEAIDIEVSGYGDSGDVYLVGKEGEDRKDEIIDLVYLFLEDVMPGWEINEGTNGNITISKDKLEFSYQVPVPEYHTETY